MISHTWNLKYNTNEHIYALGKQVGNRLPNTEDSCKRVLRKGMDWELRLSRCKQVYKEWVNNKVLLYRIGNYIQYPVINHCGKQHEKEDIYFAGEQKSTHCISQLYLNKIHFLKMVARICLYTTGLQPEYDRPVPSRAEPARMGKTRSSWARLSRVSGRRGRKYRN